MEKEKEKNKKLLVQVSIITTLIFIVTLAFTLFSDYQITRDAYLSSKQEMIDRDLNLIRNSVITTPHLEWFLQYSKEHSKDITRPLTLEESAVNKSGEFEKIYYDYITKNNLDISILDSTTQLLLARKIYELIILCLQLKAEFDYSDIYFMCLSNEDEAYMICNSVQGTSVLEDYNGIELGTVLDYSSSEHSAVDNILSGELDTSDKTLYEIYSDPDDNKYYYIGYASVLNIGDDWYVQCIKYDWSNFRSELVSNALGSMIMGFIVLIVLDILLLLFIYFNVISPIQDVTQSILEYKSTKQSDIISEKMKKIKVRNEIGVLADSFSDLTGEIDKHTKEIVRLNGEKKKIEAELNIAKKIQEDALPKLFPEFSDRKEFNIYATMTPAKEVGGDFYDFFFIDDDHLAMVMADVSGKGVPAALFMMTVKTLIKNRAQMGEYSTSAILTSVNEQIYKNNEAALFVTVWLAIIDLNTGKGTASNAGHESPAYRKKDGEFELVKYKHSPAVATLDGIRFKEHEFQMQPGDTVFMYTDGVPEATNKDDQLFRTSRMIDILNAQPNASNEQLLKNVKNAVDEFVGDAPQFDDLTMLAFTYYGKDSDL